MGTALEALKAAPQSQALAENLQVEANTKAAKNGRPAADIIGWATRLYGSLDHPLVKASIFANLDLEAMLDEGLSSYEEVKDWYLFGRLEAKAKRQGLKHHSAWQPPHR